ncbi:hypothetical protein QVD17_32116 [Tagetes erecta]|uniref:EGF-like domain-containing protein n=1 Tax=Tagetes erecta TaxID=13708 RepID=A0AAD8NPE6_TARER|nr:hypothetical protein QVD17_32116 [Tagetes erecta]
MHLNILLAVMAVIAASAQEVPAMAVIAASAQEVPAAACETSCGNVSITYPFGSGEGCYYSSDFLVTCNRSSGEPIPFFGPSSGNVVISDMSTNTSEMEIMGLVAYDCYNISGPAERNQPWLSLRDFRISSKNKFVAIGCDTYAYFSGRIGNDSGIGSGCVAMCGENSVVINGSCSGVGCCEVAVPEGMNYREVFLNSFNNHSTILDLNPCSYGFFVAQGKFNFSATNLHDFKSDRMPMLLDWAIGNLTCDKAKDMENFLCKGNSVCDQSYTGPGYRCRCLEGYEGNPYVAGNCTNINECERGNHDCEDDDKCVDIEGSFRCTCPKGYSGDGTKDGTGCRADESTVIKIVAGVSTSKALSFDGPEEERSLAMYFLNSLKLGRLFNVLDERLQLDDVPSEIMQVSRVAERCLRVNGDERPSMKEVAIELQGILASMVRKHPWVQSSPNEDEDGYLLKELSNNNFESINGVHASNVSSSTFDSMSKQTMLPIPSGR